jgi:delta14-sterol reductase
MTDFIAGFFAPWIAYALMLLLHLALPARHVVGYVINPGTGRPWEYRLNGPLVLVVTVGLWALIGVLGILPWDWLYVHRWSGLAGSSALGLVFSFAMVLPAPPTGKSFLVDFFLGRVENRQLLKGRVDGKMVLYLIGAVMLALNIISFGAHHLTAFGADPSPGVILYCALFLWFVVDYLVFERVHLYTYDIFAERIGFKLGWGCLTFYPYFYAVGLWFAADLPNPGTPAWLLVLFAVVFFAGWTLSRGANMQKFFFKIDPRRALLGIIKPRAISNGSQALLCSGFWGVARHINYLGEILMAVGLALALGWPALLAVWLYPLYYMGLLLSRERDDERRCARKYGKLWSEYVRKVPRRIVPGIY